MWVMTSRRFPGTALRMPRVEFLLGQVKIAEIHMRKSGSAPWKFFLELMHVDAYSYDKEPSYDSFRAALKDLHRLLNAPAPEGYETGIPKR